MENKEVKVSVGSLKDDIKIEVVGGVAKPRPQKQEEKKKEA